MVIEINDPNFATIDEEEYGSKTPSIKEIALTHIRKISEISCQEFVKGYWEEKPLKMGGGVVLTKVYHPDVRAVYCNSIDFLVDIVYPLSDDKFKLFIDNYEKEEKHIEMIIEKKLKIRRLIFKEMNIMFERLNFFDMSNVVDE